MRGSFLLPTASLEEAPLENNVTNASKLPAGLKADDAAAWIAERNFRFAVRPVKLGKVARPSFA